MARSAAGRRAVGVIHWHGWRRYSHILNRADSLRNVEIRTAPTMIGPPDASGQHVAHIRTDTPGIECGTSTSWTTFVGGPQQRRKCRTDQQSRIVEAPRCYCRERPIFMPGLLPAVAPGVNRGLSQPLTSPPSPHTPPRSPSGHWQKCPAANPAAARSTAG